MDFLVWWYVVSVTLLALGNASQYFINRENRYKLRELRRMSQTRFRVTRDDHVIVDHPIGTLYELSKTEAMEPRAASGKQWGVLETAYGTMRIWIARPDRFRHRAEEK